MAVAPAPNAAQAAIAPNQAWHALCQNRFGNLEETRVYNPNVNYERVYRLFVSNKYEFRSPKMYRTGFELIKMTAENVVDRNTDVIEKAFSAVILFPCSIGFSIPLGILMSPMDAAAYIDHETTNPNVVCTCMSCNKTEEDEIWNLRLHDQRTLDAVRAYHRVFPLRKDYFAPPPPPAPLPRPVTPDYDGGYAAD